MSAKVTVVTCTYNKPTLFAQCAESVLAQTFQDWVWWVVFNFDMDKPHNQLYGSGIFSDPRILPIHWPIAHGLRERMHITAHIVNMIYPKVQTPYIYWLSDDDLIDKDGLQVLMETVIDIHDTVNGFPFEEWFSVNYDAVYGRCLVQNEQPDGSFKDGPWCFEGRDIAQGENLDCVLDSGQILHTKALWDMATADGWRLTTDLAHAAHADGLLLTRLAQFATIHYVPQQICTHRRTHASEWHKPQT